MWYAIAAAILVWIAVWCWIANRVWHEDNDPENIPYDPRRHR